ncbi:MAG: RNA polymerase sigma-70 factor [Mucilaginibacter sp.]
MKNCKADIPSLWSAICIDDDLKAYELLFHLLHASLIKFCVFYIHQKEPAEEIVSDVFVKCWENRKQLTHIANPETYMFVAVKNHSLNYVKKYSNIHLVQIEDSTELQFVNIYDPQKELEKKELHFLMDKAIESLPPQASIIFRLIKEDGMKYKDVAEILNISPRTVQTQLFRAMKKLAVILISHHTKQKSAGKKAAIPGDINSLGLLILLFKIFFLSL